MKLVFVGNRRFVLEEIISQSIDISAVFVIKGTHLEKDISKLGISYKIISSKSQLLSEIEGLEFDVLVSNGCPYILPISKMPKKTYINIHPSYLPDLKGVDPAIGAILRQRDGGATCHVMNDQIDEGDIISQVKIPYTKDLDISLMYQLCFIAEKEVFLKALERKFKPEKKQVFKKELIYYSRKYEDRVLNLKTNLEAIKNQIKAFSNKSQGCELKLNDNIYLIHQLEVLKNPYLLAYAEKFDEYVVIFNFEDCIVFKKNNDIILLRSLTNSLKEISIERSLV